MKPTLSLHAGLEKTGSTSLQASLISQFPNYLSRNSIADQNRYLKFGRIREAFLHEPPSWWRTKDGNSLLIDFDLASQERMKDGLIISFENLLAHNLFFTDSPWVRGSQTQTWTSVDHLKVLLSTSVLKDFSLNLLVTVRRQPEWLASLYAQRSNRIPNASQQDFELKVRHLLERDEDIQPPLNIYKMLTEIEDKLKPDSLIVVAQETLGTLESTVDLHHWIGIDANPLRFTLNRNLNSRHLKKNHSWHLRPFGDEAAQHVGARILQRFKPRCFQLESRVLRMTEELKNQILTRTGESNRLAAEYAPSGLPGYF